MSSNQFRQKVEQVVEGNSDLSRDEKARVLRQLAASLEATVDSANDSDGITPSTETGGRQYDI